MYILEYIWIGEKYELNNKTRIIFNFDGIPPIWKYTDSDKKEWMLFPINYCNSPFSRKHNCLIVLCEVATPTSSPSKTNHRQSLCNLLNKNKNSPLLSLKYQFTIPLETSGKPYSVGYMSAIGKDIMEEFTECSLFSNLRLDSYYFDGYKWTISLRVDTPLRVIDDFIISKYILFRLDEKYKYNIKMTNKDKLFFNYSTELSRIPDKGIGILRENIKSLEDSHDTTSKLLNLTTSHHNIILPSEIIAKKSGHFCDRRMNMGSDPYLCVKITLDKII